MTTGTTGATVTCLIDLDEAPWQLLAVSREGTLRYCYLHGGQQWCFVNCPARLRRRAKVGRVAEITIERDAGGPVVTILRLVAHTTPGRSPALSWLLWGQGRPVGRP